MDIVINSEDWQRLCELQNKPSVEPGYEFTMQDVLDAIGIFRRSVPIRRILDGTLAGEDAISTRNREFYDLSHDLIEKLERGVMASSAEFYTRLDPTELTKRAAIDAQNRLAKREQGYLKAMPAPTPKEFRYHRLIDLSSTKAVVKAIGEYYALSRLCGMQDGTRYDTQND